MKARDQRGLYLFLLLWCEVGVKDQNSLDRLSACIAGMVTERRKWGWSSALTGVRGCPDSGPGGTAKCDAGSAAA